METTRESGLHRARGFIRDHRLAAFGVLVVLFTIAVAAARLQREMAPFALIFVPAVSALLIAGVADGVNGIAQLFRRIARWRVRPVWYLAAFGVPLLAWLMIICGGVILGAPVSGLFQDLGSLPVVALVVLIPAFIEEFGWRGFAVPAAPRQWPLIVTSLVVGALFLVPHVALYLPGQLYDNLPMWPLFLIIFGGSVLYTWGFAGSGQSALIAALMHATSNGLTPLSRGIDPTVVWQVQGIVMVILAIAVVVLSARMRRPLAESATEPAPEVAAAPAT